MYIVSYIYIYHISYARKLWQVASLGLFWPVSGPGARNGLNEPPGTCSGQVLNLGPDKLYTSLLGPVLARFWAWSQKCSKRASWDLFWPGSGPGAGKF